MPDYSYLLKQREKNGVVMFYLRIQCHKPNVKSTSCHVQSIIKIEFSLI